MKKRVLLLVIGLLFGCAAELPSQNLKTQVQRTKVTILDLESRNMSGQTAKTVTSFLISEVVKLGYEVYSQESLHRLTEWTAERMMFGHTDTKLIEGLARMDVSKLIFGSVNKTGNQFSISITLFDVQNSKVEKSISRTCDREDQLIEITKGLLINNMYKFNDI